MNGKYDKITKTELDKWFMYYFCWCLKELPLFREKVVKEGFKGLNQYTKKELIKEIKK